MLGPPKTRDLARPVLISLEAAVPQDHFYRHLHRVFDLSFVRDLTAGCYARGGRPSIDPEVFFRLQLIMFFAGIRSERQLMEQVGYNLAMRWYAGYNLDESLPDHSSLSKIRARLGLPVFRRFFAVITEQCVQAGLVWGEELIFDATKVRANASLDSLIPRLRLLTEEHLAHLEPSEPPTTLWASNDARWDVLEECRLDPGRPAAPGYERRSDWYVSTTDPDAVAMNTGRERAALGYHDHYVIDGGKARIILHALVTPADVMENQPMLPLLRRVLFRWRVRPTHVVADTTYGTAENIREIEASGIRAYTPLANWDRQVGYYGPSQFTYDVTHDVYHCPRGETLHRLREKQTERVVVYRAVPTICNACPVKASCTPSDHGRSLQRSFDGEYLDRVRSYHGTEEYKRAMRKRKVWIEPLFGEAKQWHGMRQFRLRGLQKVNMEGLFIAAGQNLKRLLSARGWGRRPWPDGAVGVADLRPQTCLTPT
ncbi:MAG: IS1182 family transposase [Chloroflexota bacterium]|nr:IS1182 family transposase [Chloroflexota bacterium]